MEKSEIVPDAIVRTDDRVGLVTNVTDDRYTILWDNEITQIFHFTIGQFTTFKHLTLVFKKIPTHFNINRNRHFQLILLKEILQNKEVFKYKSEPKISKMSFIQKHAVIEIH
jgi:hypothetical protein